MSKLAALKTKSANAYDTILTVLSGMFGVVFGSILAFGILSMGLTLGLMALGFSTLLMLIAIPFGGLNLLQERTDQADQRAQPAAQASS